MLMLSESMVFSKSVLLTDNRRCSLASRFVYQQRYYTGPCLWFPSLNERVRLLRDYLPLFILLLPTFRGRLNFLPLY